MPSVLGHEFLLLVRASLGTLSVWTSTRRFGPYRGWACCAASHHVSSGPGRGFAIRETVVHSYSTPYALLACGRAILCWERRCGVFGNVRSTSSMRLIGGAFFHMAVYRLPDPLVARDSGNGRSVSSCHLNPYFGLN